MSIEPALVDPVKTLIRSASAKEQRLLRAATYASLATASILILTKVSAWIVTDSVALLSSLIDSTLDFGASLITLMAVRHAMAPPDADHRFGHGKAEPLAALVQAGFIAASALLLFFEAIDRLFTPHPVSQTDIGIGVMILSIVLTLALVLFQRYVISRSQSVAIKADSAHYRADLLANLGVIAALVASSHFGLPYIDPIFGLVIAGFIAHGAWEVGSESFDMLMDRELPEEDREKIRQIAMGYAEVLGVHDLRTRRSGPDLFIQMHLDFNGQLSLTRSHITADAVEKEIMLAFPGAEVIVHQDPTTPHHHEDEGPDDASAG